jgi:ABC-type branched-subunit amino acid transport system substrate-binding protein
MRRTTLAGALIVMAVVAAACGSRVSDRQAVVEAREDARRAGLTGGVALGTGGDTGDATGDDLAGDDLSGAGGGGSGSSGGGSTGSRGSRTATTTRTSRTANTATDVGVTATAIAVGNVSTLTGPVPGLFRGALVGAQAWAAYVNSQGGIHGRRVRVVSGDDRLDEGANKAKYLELSNKVFAFVGSFSVNDSGGASELRAHPEIPDVGYALSRARHDLPNNFSPQPSPAGWRSGPYKYYKERLPADVIKNVAFFVSDVASAREISRWNRQVIEDAGFEVVYSRNIGPAESDFTSDVIRMRQAGAKAVMWQGEANFMAGMARNMRQQEFEVALPNWGNPAYDRDFIELAGSPEAVEGTQIDQLYAMFLGEDRQRVPEIDLFLTWMARIDADVRPDLYAMYAWTAGRLFQQAAEAAGPELTRAQLLAELGKVHSFDAKGMLAPGDPAGKKAPNCFMVVAIRDGNFERAHPPGGGYECGMGGWLAFRE